MTASHIGFGFHHSSSDNLSSSQPGSLSAKSLCHYQDVNWKLMHHVGFNIIQHQTQHDTLCQSTTDRLVNKVLSELFDHILEQSYSPATTSKQSLL